MNHTLVVIFSFSILIPAIIGWIRFKRIDPAYYYFLAIIWLALLNEIISFTVTRFHYSNAPNINFYILFEAILITLFLDKMKLFSGKRNIFYIILSLIITMWVIDKLIIATIFDFSPYYSALASFLIVLMSINMINKIMFVQKESLNKNALFIICICFIIFFTYALLVEIFWFYGLNASRKFRLNVYRIMAYINLFVNLIYVAAILWIPRKRKYTLL